MEKLYWMILILLASVPTMGDDGFSVSPRECREAGLPPLTIRAYTEELNSYSKFHASPYYATFSTPPGGEEFVQIAFFADKSIANISETLLAGSTATKGPVVEFGNQSYESYYLSESTIRRIALLQPHSGPDGGTIAVVLEVPRYNNFKSTLENSIYQEFLKKLELKG